MCLRFLCSFIQSTVDTVLHFLLCVLGCSYTTCCMLRSGGHVCGRKVGWGSSAREYSVSGALQEMKNENESGVGGCEEHLS